MPDAPEGLSLAAESLRALVQPTDASLFAIDGGMLVVNGFDVRRTAARVRRSIGLGDKSRLDSVVNGLNGGDLHAFGGLNGRTVHKDEARSLLSLSRV